jgi:hypothetical protein
VLRDVGRDVGTRVAGADHEHAADEVVGVPIRPRVELLAGKRARIRRDLLVPQVAVGDEDAVVGEPLAGPERDRPAVGARRGIGGPRFDRRHLRPEPDDVVVAVFAGV